MNKLTRREFIAISFIPVLALKAPGCSAPPSHAPDLIALSSAIDAPASPAGETPATIGECPECCCLGAITCPACDGTGMWTEASESAGLYQREAARANGHCAWCDECGEAACPDCLGRGGQEIRSARID